MRLSAPSCWVLPSPRGGLVNRQPTGGIVEVTPADGYALLTPFRMTTHGWQDEQPETLRYEFFALYNKGGQLANLTDEELDFLLVTDGKRLMPGARVKVLESWLAPEGDHAIVVRATDALGAASRRWRRLVVAAVSGENHGAAVDELLVQAEGTNNGFMILVAIQALVSQAVPSGLLVSRLAGALQRAAEITPPGNDVASAVGTTTADVVSAVDATAEDLKSGLAVMTETIQKLSAEQIALAADASRSMLRCLGVLCTRVTQIPGKDFALKLQTVVFELGRLLCSSLQAGESLAVASDSVTLHVRRFQRDQLEGDLASFTLTSSRRLRPGLRPGGDSGHHGEAGAVAMPGRELQRQMHCVEGLRILHTAWEPRKDPSRMVRAAPVEQVMAVHFFCGSEPATLEYYGDAHVSLPKPKATLERTNFFYDCVTSSIANPEAEFVAPPVASTSDHVICAVAHNVTAALFAIRIQQTGPLPEPTPATTDAPTTVVPEGLRWRAAPVPSPPPEPEDDIIGPIFTVAFCLIAVPALTHLYYSRKVHRLFVGAREFMEEHSFLASPEERAIRDSDAAHLPDQVIDTDAEVHALEARLRSVRTRGIQTENVPLGVNSDSRSRGGGNVSDKVSYDQASLREDTREEPPDVPDDRVEDGTMLPEGAAYSDEDMPEPPDDQGGNFAFHLF